MERSKQSQGYSTLYQEGATCHFQQDTARSTTTSISTRCSSPPWPVRSVPRVLTLTQGCAGPALTDPLHPLVAHPSLIASARRATPSRALPAVSVSLEPSRTPPGTGPVIPARWGRARHSRAPSIGGPAPVSLEATEMASPSALPVLKGSTTLTRTRRSV